MDTDLIFDLIEMAFSLFFWGGFLLLGYFVGKHNENRHIASIQKREKRYLTLPCVTSKLEHVTTPEQQQAVHDSYMVSGSVVLADDFFKKTVAGIRGMFGGNIASYESVVDRARREALLRMKEQAFGADIIVNTRIETSCVNMSSGKKNDDATTIEVLAFGTAVAFSANTSKANTPPSSAVNNQNSAPQTTVTSSAPTTTIADKNPFPYDVEEPVIEPPKPGRIDLHNVSAPTKNNSLFLD